MAKPLAVSVHLHRVPGRRSRLPGPLLSNQPALGKPGIQEAAQCASRIRCLACHRHHLILRAGPMGVHPRDLPLPHARRQRDRPTVDAARTLAAAARTGRALSRRWFPWRPPGLDRQRPAARITQSRSLARIAGGSCGADVIVLGSDGLAAAARQRVRNGTLVAAAADGTDIAALNRAVARGPEVSGARGGERPTVLRVVTGRQAVSERARESGRSQLVRYCTPNPLRG
jgi:hypothetical protein